MKIFNLDLTEDEVLTLKTLIENKKLILKTEVAYYKFRDEKVLLAVTEASLKRLNKIYSKLQEV